MSDKNTRGKVRDFQLTLEDSGRFAECLNSFDDSDSWPGGFTGGTPFTAERVFDDKKKSKDIRDLVAYTNDKIVGVCNVCEHSLHSEAAYVGLLGVNPQFQKQGYGKALLIEAAETAAKAGYRRIDLHTWGGNLKALPLYKRTGYNWVPGTRVLMESHIPGIIGSDLFKRFFEKYNWYDSFKREIKQEPDDYVENDIGIFKYRFEGENGDQLDVTVDREAKGICAFELTMGGQAISARIRPRTHVGYIGYGEFPVELTIENNQDQDTQYSVHVTPEKDLMIRMDGETAGAVAPGGSVSTTAIYTIPCSTLPIDRETNADEKVPTYAEWSIKIGERSISLFSGLIPTEAVTVSPGPIYPSLPLRGSDAISLSAKNNTTDRIRGEITLTPPENVAVTPRSFKLNLNSGEIVEEPINVSIGGDMGNLVSIDFILDLEYNGTPVKVSSKKFNIPVIGLNGAVVYKSMDNRVVLETEAIRAVMKLRPSTGFNSITYKPLKRSISGWNVLGVELGYPFPSGGDEWSRLTPEIEMKESDGYAEVRLWADLQERPGLRKTVSYRLHSGSNLLDTIVTLENTGKTTIDNLGLRSVGSARGVFDEAFVPLRGEIYNLSSIDWSGWRQLPRSTKDYHESWIAMYRHQERLLVGYIWEAENADNLRLMRGFDISRAEYRLPNLEPGEKITKTSLRLYLGDGDWRKIRTIYRRLNNIQDPETELIDLRSDLEAEIIPKKSNQKGKHPSPILVDKAKTNSHELRLRVIHETPINADIKLKLPDGLTVDGNSEIAIRVDEVWLDKPFSYPLKIEVSDSGSWFRRNGELEIRFKSRIFRMPLVAVVFDSSLKIDRAVSEEERVHLHLLSSGGYTIAACPEQGGSLVKFGETGAKSILYDTFPEAKPFVWWDKVYSGLSPIFAGMNVWNWETALQKETWKIESDKIGAWVGFKAESTFSYSPGLKDMTAIVRYLLLPGTPVVNVKVSLSNTSGQWKEPLLGFKGIPFPGGDSCSFVHTVKDKVRVKYEPTGDEVDLFTGRSSWGAFESPSTGTVLGVISAYKWDEILYVDTLSEKAQDFGMRERRALKAGESTSFQGFLIIADDVDTVEMLSDLPNVVE